jgi:hypothetical protein
VAGGQWGRDRWRGGQCGRDTTLSYTDGTDPPRAAAFLLCRYTTGKLDFGRLVGSGGMPSSHTALVVGRGLLSLTSELNLRTFGTHRSR